MVILYVAGDLRYFKRLARSKSQKRNSQRSFATPSTSKESDPLLKHTNLPVKSMIVLQFFSGEAWFFIKWKHTFGNIT